MPKKSNVAGLLDIPNLEVYIEHGIAAKDIVILASYLAQIGLTKRALALTPRLQDVNASTIDA